MNILQCEQDGDKLYSYDLYGQRILVGRTESAYKDLESIAAEATEKAEEYFNELVENGLRTKVKTQEEINTELLTQNKELQTQLSALMQELKDIKGGLSNGYSEDETNSQSARSKK